MAEPGASARSRSSSRDGVAPASTATSSARDIDLVRELGADEVIDYRTQRFEDVVADQDLVFDTVGGETWERSWAVLRPGGRLVSIAVPRPPDREPTTAGEPSGSSSQPDPEQLREIGRLIDAGLVRPIVSDVLPLERGLEAYGSGRQRGGPGKVVLLVAGSPGRNRGRSVTGPTDRSRQMNVERGHSPEQSGGTKMTTTAPMRDPAAGADQSSGHSW